MKHIKCVSLIVIVVIMLSVFTGCSAIMSIFEDDILRKNTEAMVDAIIADDIDQAHSLVDDYFSKADFNNGYLSLKSTLAGVEEYELGIISTNKNTTHDLTNDQVVTTVTSEYRLFTNKGLFIIYAQYAPPSSDMFTFYAAPYELTNYYGVGTIDNMNGASAFQWIMLLSNLIIIAFTVFAIIDCCRRKIKLKALWLVIIIVGLITIGATWSVEGIKGNLSIGWFFHYNAYITYGGGLNVIRFILPAGGILYFILRKVITKKEPQPDNTEEIEEE